MQIASKSKLQSFDWIIFIATALLIVIGLSTLYSTVLAGSDQSYQLVTRQLLALSIGLFCFAILSWIDIRYLYYITPVLYIASLVVLAVLLVYTDPIRGIKGWFVIGPVQVQPAEFVKLSVILTLGAYVHAYAAQMKTWKGLLGGLLLLAIPFVLVMVQPDLGTAVVIFSIGAAIIFFSGIDMKKLAIVGACVIAALPLLYGQLEDYQKARLTSFADPSNDPLGSGYNQIQAEIAVGSGNLLGRGWGRGTQSHLHFLPEQHTDFIFATFAEEFGFLGSVVVLVLYALLIGKSIMLALQTTDQFLFSIIIGVVVFILVHVFVNIGMNIGILPIAGLPLPLVSYGGSSLIATLMGVGMLESIAIRRGN